MATLARFSAYVPPFSFFSAVLGLVSEPAAGGGTLFRVEFEALFVQLVTDAKVSKSIEARTLNSIL